MYTPMVDTGADLIVDVDGRLLRVQVKTYSGSDESHSFKLGHRGPTDHGWQYYGENDVDLYALCWLDRGYIALLPAGGEKAITLSFERRGRERREAMAFDAVLDRLIKEI